MVLQTNKTKGRIKQDIMLLQGNKIKRKYAYLNKLPCKQAIML